MVAILIGALGLFYEDRLRWVRQSLLIHRWVHPRGYWPDPDNGVREYITRFHRDSFGRTFVTVISDVPRYKPQFRYPVPKPIPRKPKPVQLWKWQVDGTLTWERQFRLTAIGPHLGNYFPGKIKPILTTA